MRMGILKTVALAVAIVIPAKLADMAVQGNWFSAPAQAQEPSKEAAKDAPKETGKPASTEMCAAPEQVMTLIQEERKTLDDRSKKIDEEQAKLELAKERIKVEMQNLANLKQELVLLVEKSQTRHDDDVAKLVQLYQTMKPKEAAEIMNALDLDIAVTVLAEMDNRNAAPILAKMNPEKARAVSKVIMERNKLPGDQLRRKIFDAAQQQVKATAR
jgi:flagellar motility protein MotE (MotC chaperone)